MKALRQKKLPVLILATILPLMVIGQERQSSKSAPEDNEKSKSSIGSNSAAIDYVKNHAGVKEPFSILGGPIEIEIMQSQGGVFVALPDHRKLDPVVFGTPDKPKQFSGTPIITGVPVNLREVENGKFTHLTRKSPFGDKHMVMKKGRLKINALDQTATDAATTKDKVRLSASWEDEEGNTYEVKCCKKMAAHGIDFPTYGGVATNLVLHGFSGNGTPLMPSEYTYFAFWGIGEVSKNGKSTDKPRLIHGMLTEYVRTENYALGFDSDVTPERRHFHLLTVPAKPDMKNFHFKQSPVNTEFVLKNGQELPFWHVMFENLDITSSRKQ